MKLYQTKYYDATQDAASCSEWQGTQASAAGARRQLKAEGMSDIETVEVDVPTNKDALIAFLNDNKVVV